MREFSEDVKEFHANIRANPVYLKMVSQIEEQISKIPDWSPRKPMPETEHAYMSGQKSGSELIISILKGEFYDR